MKKNLFLSQRSLISSRLSAADLQCLGLIYTGVGIFDKKGVKIASFSAIPATQVPDGSFNMSLSTYPLPIAAPIAHTPYLLYHRQWKSGAGWYGISVAQAVGITVQRVMRSQATGQLCFIGGLRAESDVIEPRPYTKQLIRVAELLGYAGKPSTVK